MMKGTTKVAYISKDMLKKHLPPPADDVLITYTSRPQGLAKMLKEWLPEMGYTDDMIYEF